MTKAMIIAIVLLLFGGFLYWAYLPDCLRNPKEFWPTLIGMSIGMLLAGIGIRHVNERMRKFAVQQTEDKEN